MYRFKLFNEYEEEEYSSKNKYSIDLDFNTDLEFVNWLDKDFDDFMCNMETGQGTECGVHDGTGGTDEDGIEWTGYSSYEIKDFDLAIKKWKEFFKEKGKLKI